MLGKRRRITLFSVIFIFALTVAVFAGGQAEESAGSEGPSESNRLSVAMTPPTAEGHRFWVTTAFEALDPAMEGLVGHNIQTGEFEPTRLAESWEHNEDFTEWTFKLREGVQFHHGWGEVTAEDVIHSWELHTQPQAVVSNVEDLRNGVPTAVDKYTVRFDLERPNPHFLFLHGGRTTMFVYSKAQFEQEGLTGYDEQLVGTGPYQFVERSTGRMLYERVDDHYSGKTPDFPELELLFVGEEATRFAMLRAGEVSMAQVPPNLYPDALEAGLELIESTTPTMQTTVVFNGHYMTTGDPNARPELPWMDVRIREAINRAIPRQELLEALFEGGYGASLLPLYAMHEGHEGYDPTIAERFPEEYGYDPDRSRELMEEAGYPDSFPNPTIPLVRTVVPGNPEMPTQMEFIQMYLERVGFETEILELDHARIGERGRAREAYFLNPNRNGPIRPTEVAFRAFYTTGGGPYQGYEDDTIQALVEELVATTDPDKRDEIARRAFNYLFDQYAEVQLFQLFSIVVVDPNVVADWPMPGVTSAGIGYNWEDIQSAR
jgi:peptide/nickel transport system substrate-binding protein